MKKIKLSQNKFAIVNDFDFESLNEHNWYCVKYGNQCYAITRIGNIKISMHRFIMQATAAEFIDHKNRNGLDNRRRNLRKCTPAENSKNRNSKKGSTSKYLGVFKRAGYKHWQAKIFSNGKHYYLGFFLNEKAAALAYNKAAKRLHKKFANLNKL